MGRPIRTPETRTHCEPVTCASDIVSDSIRVTLGDKCFNYQTTALLQYRLPMSMQRRLMYSSDVSTSRLDEDKIRIYYGAVLSWGDVR